MLVFETHINKLTNNNVKIVIYKKTDILKNGLFGKSTRTCFFHLASLFWQFFFSLACHKLFLIFLSVYYDNSPNVLAFLPR